MITLHGIYFKKICQWKGINPLSPNIHLQILQTGLHRFPSRISWENLTKDQSILRGTLGGTQYHNNVRKIGKYQNTVSKIDKIPITHSDLFEGRGSCTQATFMIGHVYLKLYPYHVFVYLKHLCTRNQPQTSRENVTGPWSVQRSKSPVIGCPSNFVIDCVIIYH